MSYGLFLRTATFSPNWNICPRSPLYKQEVNWSPGTRRKLERGRFFRVHPNIIKRIKRLLRLETLSSQTAERAILPRSPVPGWIFWRCSYFRAFPTSCKGPFTHPPVSSPSENSLVHQTEHWHSSYFVDSCLGRVDMLAATSPVCPTTVGCLKGGVLGFLLQQIMKFY